MSDHELKPPGAPAVTLGADADDLAGTAADRTAPDRLDPLASPGPTCGPPPDPDAPTRDGDSPPESPHRAAPAIPGYEILGELGRGGMGVVYEARQTRLNRPCAVKMILAGAHATPEAAARFLAEAEAIARLQHPHVVQIHHIGEADGLPFFELELLPGGSLDRKLDGIPWPPRQAAHLAEQLARGVAAAHALGIVHRDLKPANVLLTADGAPKITDFGLAKAVGSESGLTRSEAILGSPSYMAPEQAGGRTKEAGPTADVYALGAILYELLTGRPPFRGATVMETLEQVKTVEPVPPSRLVPRLPRDIETICLKCLQKDPGRRYESAAALAEDLRRFQAGEPIVARPVGPAGRAWRWCRRNPVVAGLTAAVLMIFAAGFAGVTWNYWRAEAARRELESTLYFQRIALAHRELTANFTNPARAEELLEACPPQRRGWEWSYLKRLWRVEPVVLRDPGNQVIYSVALSPDGEHVAAACRDATVKVRDLRTGQVVTLHGHEKSVFSVAFSPTDGRRLASAGTDGTVRVWDWTTRQEVHNLPGRETIPVGMAQSVAFSPDGRWLAAASSGGTVRVWDATTGQLRHTLPDHEIRACVAFSPDGRLLASGNGYGIVRIWDAEAGRCLAKLGGHIHSVGGLAFSPDGRRLAAGYFDRLIDIWDPTSGKRLHSLSGHTGLVLGLAFSPDGRIASSSEDRTVRFWDLPTGQEVLLLRGHTDMCQGLAFSPDGRFLASASRDRTVRLWDATPLTVNEAQELLTFRKQTNEVWNVAISPDGTRIASAGLDPTVRVWDARTGEVIWTSLAITSAVFGVAFSPDGRRLAVAGVQAVGPKPYVVKVWDAQTGQEALTIPPPPATIFALGFSPDGRRLALGSNDGTVTLWDAGTGHEIGLLGQHSTEVRGLAFHHDGRRIASAGIDGTVKIWDMTRAQGSPRTLRRSDAAVWGVAFHPDGRRLVTVSGDDQLTLWDAETGQPIRQVGGQFSGQGLSVAFSPDGRWVASSAQDCTVKAWDATTLELLHTFRGHRGPIRGLAVSRDGKFLVTGSADKTVKVWDLTRLDTKLKD
jgi:WD40 repeat protein